MSGASARAIWCHTCGEYVRPGSHGIHASRYGRGPSSEPPVEECSSARAVVFVVAAFAGAGAAILIVILWASGAAR